MRKRPPPHIEQVHLDKQGRIKAVKVLQPSPYERIRLSFQALETEWRWCVELVTRTLPHIEDDDTGMWQSTMIRMRQNGADIVFLRAIALLEDALALAIDTHTPGHVGLPTLHDKLKFAEDIRILSRPRDLHQLKQARNDFLHSFHAAVDTDVNAALDIIAAELDHLGFGPIERITELFETIEVEDEPPPPATPRGRRRKRRK
jgi:hypothetical protein